MKNKGFKIGLTTLVLTLTFGGLLYTTMAEGTEYYKHVDEVMAQPEQLVRQEAAAAWFRRARIRSRRSRTRWTTGFRSSSNGKIVTATYTGVVPDTFKSDSEVVLKGAAVRGGLQGAAQRRDGEVPVEV